MSLRFLFQQPPSGGESECKDTTIFQTTKKNFRPKTQQGGATTDLQQLETRKKISKKSQRSPKTARKKSGKHADKRKIGTQQRKTTQKKNYKLKHRKLRPENTPKQGKLHTRFQQPRRKQQPPHRKTATATQKTAKKAPKTAKNSLPLDFQQISPKPAPKHNRLKTRPSRDQLRHMYNICTILVQYLYVYQLYKYCTTIVHILYNDRSWYGEKTTELRPKTGAAARETHNACL